ncbi:hypothetical protein [Serratia fonticola]
MKMKLISVLTGSVLGVMSVATTALAYSVGSVGDVGLQTELETSSTTITTTIGQDVSVILTPTANTVSPSQARTPGTVLATVQMTSNYPVSGLFLKPENYPNGNSSGARMGSTSIDSNVYYDIKVNGSGNLLDEGGDGVEGAGYIFSTMNPANTPINLNIVSNGIVNGMDNPSGDYQDTLEIVSYYM